MSNSVQDRVKAVLDEDANLLICKACGAQYSVTDVAHLNPQNECFMCNDDRQFVPASGQAWTSLRELAGDFEQRLEPVSGHPSIQRIITHRVDGAVGSVGIGETPLLLRTPHGQIIWDCVGFLSLSLAQQLGPVKAIVISHPHFFTTALTWARALDCKVYISKHDQQWFQRGFAPPERYLANRGAESQASLAREWIVANEQDELELVPGVKVQRCGGHFPGSSVLIWEGEGGVVFCSDTFMPAMDRKFITFMYSYPNMIPLPPAEVASIWQSMSKHSFQDIIGAWPDKEVRGGARQKVHDSACKFVRIAGKDPVALGIVP